MAVTKYTINSGEIRYKATIWSGNRPVQSKSFRRKLDATDWLKRESIKQDDEKVGRLKGSNMTFSEFSVDTYFPNAGVRESTAVDYLRMYKAYLEPTFGKRSISGISADEWASHFQKMKRGGTSAARLNRIHAVASAIYSLAVKWRFVAMNPLMLVDWEKEVISGEFKFWQQDELSSFLNWAFENAPQRFSLYHFLYETGLRISEALALQWDCVSMTQGTIEIRRAYSKVLRRVEQTTKSGHKRTLALNPSMRRTMLKLYNERRSEFVFSKEDGEKLAYETLRTQFTGDQKLAGVQRLGIHGLRHTFGSHFVMNGGSIYDLKALMGHSRIETTMIYAHLSPKHLAEKAALVQFSIPSRGNVLELKVPNHFPTIEKNQGIDAQKEMEDCSPIFVSSTI